MLFCVFFLFLSFGCVFVVHFFGPRFLSLLNGERSSRMVLLIKNEYSVYKHSVKEKLVSEHEGKMSVVNREKNDGNVLKIQNSVFGWCPVCSSFARRWLLYRWCFFSLIATFVCIFFQFAWTLFNHYIFIKLFVQLTFFQLTSRHCRFCRRHHFSFVTIVIIIVTCFYWCEWMQFFLLQPSRRQNGTDQDLSSTRTKPILIQWLNTVIF